MIAMVHDPHMTPDQLGDSQRGPKLRAVALGHRALAQQSDQPFLLSRRQSARTPRRGLGAKRAGATALQRVAPAHDTAGVAPHPARDFMQGKTLLQQRHRSPPPLFERLWRAVWSHGDTSYQDVPILLHYLCGSQ